MVDLVDKLESMEFAKVAFPRERKQPGYIFEYEAQDLSGIPCPSVFLTLSYNPQGVLNQTFISQGKGGSDERAHTESLGIFNSILLQHGVPPQALIKTLSGIQGNTRPYEIVEERKIIYPSIEDVLTVLIKQYVNERDEPLDLISVKNPAYTNGKIKVPDEGNAKYVKVNFRNDKPPLYVFPTENEEGLLTQVFLQRGKSGGDESAHAESLGKLISLGLQYRIHPFRITKILTGVRSSLVAYIQGGIYQSMEDAIGRIIFNWYLDKGVNLEESYARVSKKGKEKGPIYFNIDKTNRDGEVNLEEIFSKQEEKEVCPGCNDESCMKQLKPGTKGCFTWGCGHATGACE